MLEAAALKTAWAVVKPFAKPLGIALAIGAAWWGFTAWRDNLIEAAQKKGFATAEAQFTAKVEAANKIIEHDNTALATMGTALNAATAQRTQAIDLTVKPQMERIENEVASDSRYRDCRVSDGVLDAANAARAAVDAGIAASNPR